MVDDLVGDIQDGRLDGTARVALAMQRDPALLVRVTHELSKADEKFPDLLARENIRSDDSVISVRDINPHVIDYYLHGYQAIKSVIYEIKDVLPWACMPYASTMLTLSRGFFPKLYSPSALYTFLAAATERALHDADRACHPVEEILARSATQLEGITAAVESLWHVTIPKIKFRFGPVVAPDLLASVSAYDDMIVLHPNAPLSHCWRGIATTAITRLLLQRHYPKLDERVKEQLALLTNRVIVGEPLLLPGTRHDVLSAMPVNTAQDQVEGIAKNLASMGTIDRAALDMFPPASLGESYNIDMIRAIITLILDDTVDERELFARVSASNAGYRPFDLTFTLFQDALVMLEHARIIKRNVENNQVVIIEAAITPRPREIT